jgi:hypothetical protein
LKSGTYNILYANRVFGKGFLRVDGGRRRAEGKIRNFAFRLPP